MGRALLYQSGKRLVIRQAFRLKIIAILAIAALLAVAGLALYNARNTAYADPINSTDFVTTWRVEADDTSITVPTEGSGYNYNVDWDNDGIADQTGLTGNVTHDFGTAGDHTIRISGDFPRIYSYPWLVRSSVEKLIDINQWGTNQWQTMEGAFAYTSLSIISAPDAPDLSQAESTVDMFYGAESFNSDISGWNTANVTDMSNMFNNARSFNRGLSSWNTSQVTNMSGMFGGAESFNSDISGWNTANVTNMRGMFRDSPFNVDISSWTTSNVMNMSRMFEQATSFNQPLNSWDTSSVTDMSSMFGGATSFNQPLNSWDTSSVTDMGDMFSYFIPTFAPGGSDLSAFDQSLGSWNVSQVESMNRMLNDTSLSLDNYDATLSGWAQQPSLQSDVQLGAGGLSYHAAQQSRQKLIDDYGWDISGDRLFTPTSNITIDGEMTTTLPATNVVGDIVGQLAVDGSEPITFAIACANPSDHDSLFAIDASNNLVTTSHLGYTPGGANTYKVCIHATNAAGSTEQEITITTTDNISTSYITDVEFMTNNGQTGMLITGVDFNPSEDSDMLYYSTKIMTESLVTLNGDKLPFCTVGTGVTAEFLIAEQGIDPALVSDTAPCYLVFTQSGGGQPNMLITDTQAVVFLPSDFDTTAEGTVSVNTTPTFTFNRAPQQPSVAIKNNGDTVSLTGNPIIQTRPTFAGTAEPGASITVTVHSDPISCTTTAAADGSWSCTLPQSLPAGEHTVYVRVTLADSTVQELGPYAVTVASDGSSNPITDATPGAPTTGAAPLASMKSSGSIIPFITLALISVGAIVLLTKKTLPTTRIAKRLN